MKKKLNTDRYKNSYTHETLTGYGISHAFDGIREELHLKPLKKQKEKPLAEHVCPICKSVKTWISGTNIMVCTNPECQGFKPRTAKDDVSAMPSYSKIGSFKNH